MTMQTKGALPNIKNAKSVSFLVPYLKLKSAGKDRKKACDAFPFPILFVFTLKDGGP